MCHKTKLGTITNPARRRHQQSRFLRTHQLGREGFRGHEQPTQGSWPIGVGEPRVSRTEVNSARDGATSVCARPTGPAAHAIQAPCWRLRVSTLRQPVTADETPTGGPDGSWAHCFQAWSGAARPRRTVVRYLHPRVGHRKQARGEAAAEHQLDRRRRGKGQVGAHVGWSPSEARAALQVLRWGVQHRSCPRTPALPRPVRPGVWARRPVVAAGRGGPVKNTRKRSSAPDLQL